MIKATKNAGGPRHAPVGMHQTGNYGRAIRPDSPTEVERPDAGTRDIGAMMVDRPVEVPVYMALALQPLAGYASTTGRLVATALATWVSKGTAGQCAYRISRNDLLAVAKLSGEAAAAAAAAAQMEADALGATYKVISIQIGFSWDSLADADLTIACDRTAKCSLDNIRLTVF
ncbi:MAG: hypothetical protein JWO51_3660 [Rhodospirillales bacterium]|jgi:hypothetical protein|nr:hypothetical protein [Rhodospirillales bacterium]